MKISLRITHALLRTVHADLDRAHSFAAERVGFLTCGVATVEDGIGIYAAEYHPIDDDDYEDDMRASAMIGAGAFRKMLQRAYKYPCTVLHVHRHDHKGTPRPSQIDLRESAKFIPDFWKVCPQHPHGTLILSFDAISGRIWVPEHGVRPLDHCQVIGEVTA